MKKLNGGKKEYEDQEGANIRWTGDYKFEFNLEDDEGRLTKETRIGVVRSLSNKQQKRAKEKLKEIYGEEIDFNPNKIADIWGTDPEKLIQFSYFVITAQNPHIAEDDLESLSIGALGGILVKIVRASQLTGYQLSDISFLSASPTPSTETGTAESAEEKNSIEKETVTDS
jgi:DNA-directed RNA polymerase subunit H (RpoH/RPB5)